MGTRHDFDVAKLGQDMRDRGWLQADLAKRARVTQATVSRILLGRRSNARTVKKLAKALGQDISRYQLSARDAAHAGSV